MTRNEKMLSALILLLSVLIPVTFLLGVDSGHRREHDALPLAIIHEGESLSQTHAAIGLRAEGDVVAGMDLVAELRRGVVVLRPMARLFEPCDLGHYLDIIDPEIAPLPKCPSMILMRPGAVLEGGRVVIDGNNVVGMQFQNGRPDI